MKDSWRNYFKPRSQTISLVFFSKSLAQNWHTIQRNADDVQSLSLYYKPLPC